MKEDVMDDPVWMWTPSPFTAVALVAVVCFLSKRGSTCCDMCMSSYQFVLVLTKHERIWHAYWQFYCGCSRPSCCCFMLCIALDYFVWKGTLACHSTAPQKFYGLHVICILNIAFHLSLLMYCATVQAVRRSTTGEHSILLGMVAALIVSSLHHPHEHDGDEADLKSRQPRVSDHSKVEWEIIQYSTSWYTHQDKCKKRIRFLI